MRRNSSLMPIVIIIGAMIVLNIVEGSFSNIGDWLYRQILMLPGIVVAISFHEFAHGIVSHRLGDPTPKEQGRLTLNPLAHIDWIGFFCLFLAGFGWGKPVEIDPRYYKHPRRDDLLVSLAGVIMNFILAIAFAFLMRLLIGLGADAMSTPVVSAAMQILQYCIFINLVLMVFNLIPVPPLDGWGIVTQIFNLEKYSWYWTIYQYGFLILLALIFFGVTEHILNPAIQFLWMLISKIII